MTLSQNNHSIAVISDVHSNAYALEAVLHDIDSRGIETIVNLGDTLFGPLDPIKTAELLMERAEIIHIMGNCDRYLLGEQMESMTFQYVKPLLTQEMLSWIGSFQKQWTQDDLLFCHGTPFADDIYLLENVAPYGIEDKSANALMIELTGIQQKVIFCGHSHVPKSVWLPDGKLVVNPGSVGLPAYFEETPYPHSMESKTPHAKYVTVKPQSGSWLVEHVLVPYDFEKAARRAEENGRRDYAYAIRTGRAEL
ncbi:metallophosphoesterase family protein [Brevibacillus sp. HB1.3]|uniref:metallophosphoesterase family protein n=1 Tax=Brevibacillus sp. HB1.3 TaxID=2738842 RepID=UPI0015563E5B|nr:metallophosphoesterase family protein [Brevibacillus sp. HB1.3]NQF15708.1 metallophosphoesterase family protein [Brevibacillus sp. HB1.3]